jgi:PhnB protein
MGKSKKAGAGKAKAKAKANAKAAAPKAKKVKPKPKGMRWVNPYLTVRDVDAALAWYEKAFGFKTTFKMPGPDGKTVHAEMRHRKSPIMLSPELPDNPARTPGQQSAPVSMYCYCDDVDAVAASARAAGANVLEEPADQFWGDRTCFLIDPEGHKWMFATHKFEMAPGEGPPACPEKDKTETMPAVGSAKAAAAAR